MMEKSYENLFSNLERVNPPEGFEMRIIETIAHKSRTRARIRVFGLGTVAVVSFVGLVPAYESVALGFTHSSFGEYFSLLFSDGGVMLSYWRDFLTLLAEALPVTELALLFGLALVCAASVRTVAHNVHAAFLSTHTA